MFAREGYALIAGAALLAGLLVALGVWIGGWGHLLGLLGLGAVGFTLYFFRDPDRVPPPNADAMLLAPADGTVVDIVDEPEPLYLDGPSQRISIFLSPLDVHVNRTPAAGVIEYAEYRPGDYLVAWHPKASDKNERSEIGLRHPSGVRVLFKQIAGAVARRIVYHVAPGDPVQAGDRFGIVKFGSRMDVHVPPHVNLDVEVDQVVRAGETVLGHLPSVEDPATASSSHSSVSSH